jgi:hypothetical protein
VLYNTNIVADGIMSMVPEATGLCKVRLTDETKNEIRNKIRASVNAFQLEDPLIVFSGDLVELMNTDIGDSESWTKTALAAIKTTKDTKVIEEASKALNKRIKANPHFTPGALVMKHLMRRYAQVVVVKKHHRFSLSEVQGAIDAQLVD